MLQGKILCWNCRGIVNNETQRALFNLVQARRPSLTFLSETLASKDHISEITKRIGFKDFICFPSQHESQGVALLWNDETQVEFRSSSPRHIDVIISNPHDHLRWRFTGLYDWSKIEDIHKTGALMKALADQDCTLPWLIAGDINEILCQADKSGGLARPLWQMLAFRRALEACALTDMGYYGSRFTWSNRFTKERLEALQTEDWKRIFPWSRCIILEPSDSDHLPLLIEVAREQPVRNVNEKPFRFEESWYGDKQIMHILQQHFALPTT